MDYHYSPDTIFGFALGGGGTNWGLGTGRYRTKRRIPGGVYGITRSGPAYLAAAVPFANHWMTTNRGALGDALRQTSMRRAMAGASKAAIVTQYCRRWG